MSEMYLSAEEVEIHNNAAADFIIFMNTHITDCGISPSSGIQCFLETETGEIYFKCMECGTIHHVDQNLIRRVQ